MKKRRRIEVIRYSSRVTVIESGGAVEKAVATAVPPVIDIVQEEPNSPAGEISALLTALDGAQEKRAPGWIGRLRKLLRPKRG